jgi:hypothetical protein
VQELQNCIVWQPAAFDSCRGSGASFWGILLARSSASLGLGRYVCRGWFIRGYASALDRRICVILVPIERPLHVNPMRNLNATKACYSLRDSLLNENEIS